MKTRYLIPNLPVFPCENNKNILTKQNLHEEYTHFFHRTEENIKQSLFISTIAHCDSIESAKSFIDCMKYIYSDATHNCSAYAVGEPQDSNFIGYSDDGEPHGTAGKPMLTQLLHSNTGELAVVVTRYFGGIKLGTGGLVRAYQGSVALCLETLVTCEKIIPIQYNLILDYSHAGFLHRMKEDFQLTIIDENFGADISYILSLPQDKANDFITAITSATEGTVIISPID